MARAKALVAVIVAGLAIGAAVAVASGPSVTITSPKTGSALSAKRTPSLTVAGTAAFAAVNPTSVKFYLRRDGCGTSSDNPHLSVTSGSDAGEGCGFVGGNGIVSTVSKGLFSVDYPSSDGMPLILDTSKTIEGTLDLQNDVAGTGQVTLDFTMEALVGGDGVIVGTDSETVLVDACCVRLSGHVPRHAERDAGEGVDQWDRPERLHPRRVRRQRLHRELRQVLLDRRIVLGEP